MAHLTITVYCKGQKSIYQKRNPRNLRLHEEMENAQKFWGNLLKCPVIANWTDTFSHIGHSKTIELR